MERQSANPAGRPPAIVLIDPQYPHNVGTVVRSASCFGVGQVWTTGDRVPLTPRPGYRLPREERMKGYRDVQLQNCEHPLEQFRDVTPVAIEVREHAENLFEFEHPENPVWVFGPEDGSIPSSVLRHCHRFVMIPARHCLNLATAVSIILYDWRFKRWLSGEDEHEGAAIDWLNEHRGFLAGDH